jgi:hypothetical protein
MLGNIIRAPKKMLNDNVKDTMYVKKKKSKPLPIHKNNYRFKKAFTKLPLQRTPRRFIGMSLD